MRKADYAALAEILSDERKAGYVKMRTGCGSEQDIGLARMNHAEAVARTFAKRTRVNETEFLKACGIESDPVRAYGDWYTSGGTRKP